MDKRLIFNNNIDNYDIIRPTYPDELYNDILKYMNITNNTNAVEIGIGTGQATRPFLDKNFHVTAVDIGEKLINSVREKFSSYSNFNAILGDFMTEFLPENNYDLIYSATAFHWLPDEKYLKVKKLLKSGGIIALFWNRPFVRNLDDITNVKNAKVYDRYYGVSDKAKQFSEEDTFKICSKLEESCFNDIKCEIYRRTRTLSTGEYIKLLNTYSDHCSLPKAVKVDFENDIIKALSKCGNEINIYDTIDLYLGKKY